VIAETNAITSAADLRSGMTLVLPNEVASNRNDFRTFKPFDAAEIRGDTSPTLPMPSGDNGGCGAFGQIIVAIVVVVVAVVTQQYCLASYGTAATATTSTGLTLVGTDAAVAEG
jgi:hypothetical protein